MHAAALLHELAGPAQHEADVKLEFFERAKGDDGSAHIQKMIDILKGANGSVGALPKVVSCLSCCDTSLARCPLQQWPLIKGQTHLCRTSQRAS